MYTCLFGYINIYIYILMGNFYIQIHIPFFYKIKGMINNTLITLLKSEQILNQIKVVHM